MIDLTCMLYHRGNSNDSTTLTEQVPNDILYPLKQSLYDPAI